jgi:hypothetical protein
MRVFYDRVSFLCRWTTVVGVVAGVESVVYTRTRLFLCVYFEGGCVMGW